MKAIVITTTKHGHVNASLEFAAFLAQQGWDIHFPSNETFKNRLTERGIHYVDYSSFNYDYKRPLPFTVVSAGVEVLRVSNKLYTHLRKYIQDNDFDLVLYDRTIIWGSLVAHDLDLPSVSFSTLPILNMNIFHKYNLLSTALGLDSPRDWKHYHKFLFQLRKLSKKSEKFQTSKILVKLFNNDTDINLVFTTPKIQPDSNKLLNNYSYLGIAAGISEFDTEPNMNISSDSVYISLGTSFNGNERFYEEILNYYSNRNTQIIISVPDRISRKLRLSEYENIIYGEYLPQKQILKRVKYFITHGGFNSINEALFVGVPLVVVPQMIEQQLNGMRVEELKVGLLADDELSFVGKFKELEDNYDLYKSSAMEISKSFDDTDEWLDVEKKIVEYVTEY